MVMCMDALWMHSLERLAELVTRRREELGLTKEEAARRVPMSSQTLKKVEDAERVTGVSYAKVDVAMHWERGSCKSILAGGDPRPLVETVAAAPHTPAYVSRQAPGVYRITPPKPLSEMDDDELRRVIKELAATDLEALPPAAASLVSAAYDAHLDELARRMRDQLDEDEHAAP
jgi:transcriptional regulator with XRE-family HTH domain